MGYLQSKKLCAPSVSLVTLVCFIAMISCSEGNVNLNIRSSALSQAMRDNEQTNLSGPKDDAESQSSTSKKQKGRSVALDKSGQFNCHVVAPQVILENGVKEEDGQKPLFRWGTNVVGIPTPSLHLGAKYDFGTVWYGATRLLTTLSWGDRRQSSLLHTSNDVDAIEIESDTRLVGKIRSRIMKSVSPSKLKLRTERGLLEPNDYSAEITVEGLQKSSDDNPSPTSNFISARFDTGGGMPQRATISFRSSIHRRIDIVSRSTVLIDGSNRAERSYFSQRFPVRSSHRIGDEAWMPDIRLSPTGQIVSRNEWKLNTNRPKDDKTGQDLGLRLTVRKQLDWNEWGISNSDNDTLVRLELCGINSSRDSFSSIAMESALERIVDKAKLTITSEQVIR